MQLRQIVTGTALLVAVAPGVASAEDIKVKPLVDARLRYEHIDQNGIVENGDALTLRVRPGVEAKTGGWSVLVEGEANIVPVYDYNDGTNGKTAFPLIVDPPNLELNRAQIQYEGKAGLVLTAGRQRLEMMDQRFVGPAGFRQNEQTFDAVRLRYGKPKGLSADLAYSWSVRTVNGRNGTGARQTAIGGDNVFAILNYGFKPGTLSAFAFLVDQDEAVVQGYRLSSQTYGLRFAGSQPLSKTAKLGYVASWARQSDWHRNPNNYSANYWLGELTATVDAFTATGGYEILGASNGTALTSVQTPLASFFRFNGWAGKFGTTPPNGLRDLYANLGYSWKKVGGLDSIGVNGVYHNFESDRLSQHYGNEAEFVLTAKRGKTLGSVRYAHYDAKAFATDTDRLWLTLEWSL